MTELTPEEEAQQRELEYREAMRRIEWQRRNNGFRCTDHGPTSECPACSPEKED